MTNLKQSDLKSGGKDKQKYIEQVKKQTNKQGSKDSNPDFR